MMKHFIYPLLFCCIITTTVSAQTTTSFLTLGEGNSTGDGTFIGMSSYSTQPCDTKSFALEHHFYGYVNSSINFFRGGGMTGGFLTFNTNDNNERMRIDPNGNVGIGTDNPQANLHIRSSTGNYASLRLESLGTGQNASTQYVSGGLWRWELGTGISSGTNFELYDRVNNKACFVIKPDGFMGIGTTKPAYKLDVLGTIRA